MSDGNESDERKRITSRPPAAAEPTKELQEFSGVVATRLASIDDRLGQLALALIEMGKNLGSIQTTAESIYAMLADEILAVRQESLELAHGVKQLDARVVLLEEAGEHVNGKWEGK